MAALRTALAGVALALAVPAHADCVARWRAYVDEASARFAIPAPWIERVLRAESAGMTRLHGRPITSRAGAIGLMQLMPATWTAMRARLGLGADPQDPHDNILAGALYLRLLYDRFGYPGLFAAYNAGPTRYAAYLASQRALPAETRAYLAAVTADAAAASAGVADPPRTGLFFNLHASPAPVAAPPTHADSSLFVPLARPGPPRQGAGSRGGGSSRQGPA